MIIEVKPELELFRYDLDQPGSIWDSKTHANKTEYSFGGSTGIKNQISAYFLYDNISSAKAVAQISCHKQLKKKYWLTKTKINSSVKLIDFSHCNCIHEVLDTLESLRIDVCTKDFIVNGTDRTLEELIGHNYNSRIHPSLPYNIEVGYLGQLLTDFVNGLKFLDLLKKNDIIVDGYRFCEEFNPYGLTYCLFNASKLHSPESEIIDL